MTKLIIAEKPAAANRIAYALSDNKIAPSKKYNVPYYELTHKGEPIIVSCAVGHLYTLSQKEKKQGYPVLDPVWKASWEVNSSSAYTKKYGKLMESLAKKADEVIVATDFDREGSVIGYNCVRFLAKRKEAGRMKFSTLTVPDLKKAYENMSKELDWGQINAGVTRHYLDFLWGISLSKAAMSAVSTALNRFVTLSIGRVQGPALAILTEREYEIEKFKPKDYWEIYAIVDLYGENFEAIHKNEKFFNQEEANNILNKIKDKDATISSLKISKKKTNPPVPFDLTSLQIEAYSRLKISPKQTLSIAQKLYTNALISYPRTSSQKLPKSLGFDKILSKLAKNPTYSKIVNEVLKTNLKPNEGKKDDPAHPSIYPTGELARGLEGREKKLYDLIVKRFFAVFGDPAEIESTHVEFDIEEELFKLNGQKIVKEGWIAWYKPYYKSKKLILPTQIKKGETYSEKTRIDKKQTKPPKRYTPASIIKKLEKNNLGTKATRASIIDTLYNRKYIEGKSITVSKLGKEIVNTFSKYSPEILSKELTSKFEKEMEEIEKGKEKKEKVIDNAKKVLINICEEFDKHKKEIGEEIGNAAYETKQKQQTLRVCPKCGKGSLRVIRSKRTKKRFLACNKYPECKTTWPLPQKGKLQILTKKCKDCDTPMVSFISKGRRPWTICVNPNCPSKKNNLKKK